MEIPNWLKKTGLHEEGSSFEEVMGNVSNGKKTQNQLEIHAAFSPSETDGNFENSEQKELEKNKQILKKTDQKIPNENEFSDN